MEGASSCDIGYMQKIVIHVGELTIQAELNDSETAKQIAAALTIRASANA